MIYLSHNLKDNYLAAEGTGNAKMKRDILLSEIAKLIVKRPDRVVVLLKQAGLSQEGAPQYKDLVKLTARGLGKSKAFAKMITAEIIGKPVTVSADGAINYGDTLAAAADLVNGMGVIFGGNKKSAAESKKAQEAAEKALSEKTNALKHLGEAPSSIWKYIRWSIVIGGGIAVAVNWKKIFVKA